MARKRILGGIAALGVAAAAAWALHDLPEQLGARPLRSGGSRAERIRRSPQFDGEVFVNTLPESTVVRTPPVSLLRELTRNRDARRPAGPIPLRTPPSTPPPADGVRAVWLGHSTALIEIEGRRVLLDPVWSDRASPSRLLGPVRLHQVPVAMPQLPAIDAILISHDHYDHLDRASVLALAADSHAPFLVPLGVGAHLERWGVPADRIRELDWQEETEVSGLRFVATAARHFSGRSTTRNDTLWGSWVIAGAKRRVFYAGDSGYFSGYQKIGSQHGPFDLTIMPIGAYNPAWPDIHMDPEQAVTAQLDLGGSLLLPVHWGTFTLAVHPWGEPVDRLWREAKARAVDIVVPRPGEGVDITAPAPVDGWWQTL